MQTSKGTRALKWPPNPLIQEICPVMCVFGKRITVFSNGGECCLRLGSEWSLVVEAQGRTDFSKVRWATGTFQGEKKALGTASSRSTVLCCILLRVTSICQLSWTFRINVKIVFSTDLWLLSEVLERSCFSPNTRFIVPVKMLDVCYLISSVLVVAVLFIHELEGMGNYMCACALRACSYRDDVGKTVAPDRLAS